MKANKVNLKGLQEINIGQELESVVLGSGTYADIEEAINNKVVSLLKDSFGDIVGISYNSGKTGIEDAIEGLKFEKRFYGHDVLAYVYKALTGKDIYEDMFDDRFGEEDFDDALPTLC